MALINNIKYYTEWTKGSVQYRLECVLAGDTVLTTPQEIEFPAAAFLDSRKCDGGYEDNEPIGCPTAHEETYEIDLAGFRGTFLDSDLVQHSWVDVGDLVVQRGIAVDSTELAFNYYTNRWILKKRIIGGTYAVVFDGFQIPTGDARKITSSFGTNGFKSTIEIKAQDAFRSLLADVNIDKSMIEDVAGVVFVKQCVPILTSNLIPTGHDDDRLFVHTLCATPNLNIEALSDDDDTFKSSFVAENYVMISYNSIFSALNYRIAYVAYQKYRMTTPSAVGDYQSIFTNEFYTALTFYKINHTFEAVSTKGDALELSDYKLLYEINSWTDTADKTTQTYEATWNVFEDGNLVYDSAYDMVSEWAIATANKVKLYNATDSTLPIFQLLKINEKYNDDLITISPGKVVNNPEWSELRDNITAASYHYSDIDNSTASEYKIKTPGTLAKQPSYEIDSGIDTMYSNIDFQDVSSGVPEKMYLTTLGATSIYYRFELGIFYECGSKFSNLFYLEDIAYSTTGTATTTVAINPANVITCDGTDYGDPVAYPVTYYATDVNSYYAQFYIQNFINDIHDNPAYPALWASLIESVFGVSAGVWTVQLELGGEFFDPSMIGAGITMPFDSFVDTPLTLGVPAGGYITSIEDYDNDKDVYKINILLTTGIYF